MCKKGVYFRPRRSVLHATVWGKYMDMNSDEKEMLVYVHCFYKKNLSWCSKYLILNKLKCICSLSANTVSEYPFASTFWRSKWRSGLEPRADQPRTDESEETNLEYDRRDSGNLAAPRKKKAGYTLGDNIGDVDGE